jgi:hypothetical protein
MAPPPSPTPSPIPPPLRLTFKFEWEQTSQAKEQQLFTPEPFPANTSDAYNHYLSLTRQQREDIPQRGSITEVEESLYHLEGALPVRQNELADDVADQNALKSLEELKGLNALRDMMDDHHGDLVGPPSDHRHERMRMGTGGKGHRKLTREHPRQHDAAFADQDAEIDDDPEDPRPNRLTPLSPKNRTKSSQTTMNPVLFQLLFQLLSQTSSMLAQLLHPCLSPTRSVRNFRLRKMSLPLLRKSRKSPLLLLLLHGNPLKIDTKQTIGSSTLSSNISARQAISMSTASNQRTGLSYLENQSILTLLVKLWALREATVNRSNRALLSEIWVLITETRLSNYAYLLGTFDRRR